MGRWVLSALNTVFGGSAWVLTGEQAEGEEELGGLHDGMNAFGAGLVSGRRDFFVDAAAPLYQKHERIFAGKFVLK